MSGGGEESAGKWSKNQVGEKKPHNHHKKPKTHKKKKKKTTKPTKKNKPTKTKPNKKRTKTQKKHKLDLTGGIESANSQGGRGHGKVEATPRKRGGGRRAGEQKGGPERGRGWEVKKGSRKLISKPQMDKVR